MHTHAHALWIRTFGRALCVCIVAWAPAVADCAREGGGGGNWLLRRCSLWTWLSSTRFSASCKKKRIAIILIFFKKYQSLSRINNKLLSYMSACVTACVRACMRACVRAWVWSWVCVHASSKLKIPLSLLRFQRLQKARVNQQQRCADRGVCPMSRAAQEPRQNHARGKTRKQQIQYETIIKSN